MRGYLGVRIRDGRSDRTVTRYVSDLRFTKTAPGGHHSGSLTMKIPRHAFPDLGPADKVFVYDTRNGRTVMEGYTENPGTNDGTDGQTFDLSFNGGLVLAADRAERLIYIDSTLDSWHQDTYYGQATSGQADVGSVPDGYSDVGTPALFCQFNSGSPVTTNKQVGLVYDKFLGSPMTVGAMGSGYISGQTDTNYHLEVVAVPHLVAENNAWDVAQGATGGFRVYAGASPTTAGSAGGTTPTVAIPAGKNGMVFRLARRAGGATNVATENVWGLLMYVTILAQFCTRYGVARDMVSLAGSGLTTTNPDTGTSSSGKVYGFVAASDVVEDLLGRIMTFCDPAVATVEATTTVGVNAQINQLAWVDDAVTASGVLDELGNYEPDYLWEVLETGGTGLHRFNYRAWPTTPRYQVSTLDGYDAPGGDADLCNRVIVNWTNTKGEPQVTVVGAYVPELGNTNPVAATDGTIDSTFVGRIKDSDPITLPDGRGSLINATRVGTATLTAKSSAQKSGTVVIDHPIMDLTTGLMVQPWEILPGYLVRVRQTGDDLRLTEVEYQDGDTAATLTLGTPQLTDDQILAAVEPRATRR